MGSGLGLQVVEWIASEHGGRLIHGQAHNRVISALHLPLAGPKPVSAPAERGLSVTGAEDAGW